MERQGITAGERKLGGSLRSVVEKGSGVEVKQMKQERHGYELGKGKWTGYENKQHQRFLMLLLCKQSSNFTTSCLC